MIRVLHVIGAMDRGGAETMIMNLYRTIDRDKIQFDFAVHTERHCDYDDEILRLGGKIHRFPQFTGPNALSYRRAFRRFFARHPEYHIVHGHIASSAVFYLSAAKQARRYTIAHSHAQNFPLNPQELVFRIITYPTKYIANYFMAAWEEAGRDRYGRAFSTGDRHMVLKNGVDLSLYTCDEDSHEKAKRDCGFDAPVIGHVGRLAPEKNHDFLFDMIALVKARIPEAKLVCVGRGPLLDQKKSYASRIGLADSVEFLGVRGDVPELLRSFDIFVFPSVKEGLAIAAIEAQASGLPTLLSTGLPAAAVVSDITQRLPLSEGPQEWADRCVALLQNLPERHDRVEMTRAHGFDIHDTARWLGNFYLQVSADRHA